MVVASGNRAQGTPAGIAQRVAVTNKMPSKLSALLRDRTTLSRIDSFTMYRMYIATRDTEPATVFDAEVSMKRTQIYLDEEHDRELARRAQATGVTKSELIRRAIAQLLAAPDDEARRLARFRRAVDAVAGRVPDLPEGRVYVDRLRRADVERQRELEARRDR